MKPRKGIFHDSHDNATSTTPKTNANNKPSHAERSRHEKDAVKHLENTKYILHADARTHGEISPRLRAGPSLRFLEFTSENQKRKNKQIKKKSTPMDDVRTLRRADSPAPATMASTLLVQFGWLIHFPLSWYHSSWVQSIPWSRGKTNTPGRMENPTTISHANKTIQLALIS